MTGDILVTCPCLPVHLPTGQVRSWSRLPGRAVPLAQPAPAASSACVHWTLTLLVRAGPSLTAGGGVIWLPQGSLKPSLLQRVPRLLGLSPHISPRCCLLRLGYLPPPAVVQGRVRPRAATGELAGGKTLPVSCPMDRGGGGRKIVALNRVQNETRHTSSVLLLQGGCTGLCHRTAVLWLPGKHEGPGECLSLCPYELSL